MTLLLCWSFAMVTYAGDLQEYRETPAPPPLVLKDNHDQQHSLEDYLGKVVLVNFWAGWCHPCIQEIPEMIRLTEILADRPFVILAINVGEEQRKLPGFVKKMDEHMVILMDTDSQAFKRWKGIGLPSTFVIDPGGQIRYEAYGPVNWDAPYVVTMLTELMDTSTAEATPPNHD
ncbi:MAG: TlpA disulfide reductase family protein [Pseudomonadota bacterium]